MIKRGVRPPFIIAFLLALSLGALAYASCPLLTHSDANEEREFQNVCQQISGSPLVTVGAGVPGLIPKKTGDEYIDTTNRKVYFATATVTTGSWIVVN